MYEYAFTNQYLYVPIALYRAVAISGLLLMHLRSRSDNF